jgi:hypothetical protein
MRGGFGWDEGVSDRGFFWHFELFEKILGDGIIFLVFRILNNFINL